VESSFNSCNNALWASSVIAAGQDVNGIVGVMNQGYSLFRVTVGPGKNRGTCSGAGGSKN
jgi:hypothetical protein